MRFQPLDALRVLPGVGPKVAENLQLMGLRTVADLLNWFPRRYIDASHPVEVASAPTGIPIAVQVEVQSSNQNRTKNRRLTYIDVLCTDSSGEITVRWFNQPYLVKKLVPGSRWTLIGSIEPFRGQRILMNPVIEEDPRILPVYLQSKAINSRFLRGLIDHALSSPVADTLPEEVRNRESLPSRAEAMHYMHHPDSLQEVEQAQAYFAFEEVFHFFASIDAARRNQIVQSGIPVSVKVEWLKKVVDTLPFELTNGQKRIIWDCLQGIEQGKLMTRLINGDVGSGKTVVAALVAAVVAQAGYRTLVLVPTEILAKQHLATFSNLLKTAGCRVALWTGAQKDNVAEADIVVGTHALLQEKFNLDKVGLVVVDEQHRFGVKQRSLLRDRQDHPPHVLSMTATPIPRTLALVLFADLEVSFLKEKPKNRLPIITSIVYPHRRGELHQKVMAELQAGRQVFVLCPLIDKEEVTENGETLFDYTEVQKQDQRAAIQEVERLRKEHPEYGVIEALHGKQKPQEKRAIMERMAAGDINVLVATPVIEVGIDIPNATVMIVENAERFGLAQLHQLRGRVGRGEEQAYCFLCPSHPGGEAIKRLQVLVDYDDGFTVAEQDLALRGPGDMSGFAQSGLPDFRMARLTDLEFLQHVRTVAEEYLREHPEFIDTLAENQYSNQLATLE